MFVYALKRNIVFCLMEKKKTKERRSASFEEGKDHKKINKNRGQNSTKEIIEVVKPFTAAQDIWWFY